MMILSAFLMSDTASGEARRWKAGNSVPAGTGPGLGRSWPWGSPRAATTSKASGRSPGPFTLESPFGAD